ncbi:hypothetical protein WP2S18C03_35890 [Aeromonas veronii]|nr:hypothetical protein WP2S18C03_35890 [Aeromonas veronii]
MGGLPYHPTIDDYQANELVSCDYREQLDLRRFDDKINGALMFVFGEDLEHVHIGAYSGEVEQ